MQHFKTPRKRFLCAALVSALLMLFAGRTLAQEDSPSAAPGPSAAPSAAERKDMQAKDLFKAASLQFDDGKYELALALFRDAYAKSKRPQLLYNIALSAERVGKLDEAIDGYRRYVAAMPEGERAEESRSRILSLTALQQKLVTTDEAAASARAAAAAARAEAQAQGSAAAPTQEPAPAPVEPTTTLPPVQDESLALQPERAVPLIPSGAAEAGPRPWYKQWWVWTAAGVLVSGAIAGAVLANQDPGYEAPVFDGADGKRVMTLTVQR